MCRRDSHPRQLNLEAITHPCFGPREVQIDSIRPVPVDDHQDVEYPFHVDTLTKVKGVESRLTLTQVPQKVGSNKVQVCMESNHPAIMVV